MGIVNVNLKRLYDERGWQLADLVSRLGRTPSYWSDRLANKPDKNIGSKVARQIEEVLGLPRYWLDDDHEKVLSFPKRSAHPDKHIAAVVELMEASDERGRMECFAAVRAALDRYEASRSAKASGE